MYIKIVSIRSMYRYSWYSMFLGIIQWRRSTHSRSEGFLFKFLWGCSSFLQFESFLIMVAVNRSTQINIDWFSFDCHWAISPNPHLISKISWDLNSYVNWFQFICNKFSCAFFGIYLLSIGCIDPRLYYIKNTHSQPAAVACPNMHYKKLVLNESIF